MLELREIHSYYGDSHILQGLSLQVGKGELVSILGRNGAGKTTTINSIIGFVPPRRGSVLFDNRKISGLPPYRVARMGIGLVPQGRRIFPTLTVAENLAIGARKAKNGRGDGWSVDRALEFFPSLQRRKTNKGNQLSGGEQQMVAIARALVANPKLLLMDEPSEGLAPIIVREIAEVIRQLKHEGYSILLVEQNFHLALRAADRVYVMNKGQIVHTSTPQELEADEEVKEKYLGV
ncbi:MAG: ABC transporter ATP-binding protein [Firmicutes bacterium]|nr:ABC transporter ATP-binding protein [Bacillota bacterium]